MYPINRIEAIVDAIAALHEYHKPDSLAYSLRNPLLLKSYAKPGKHEITEDGLRVFDSHIGGYKAGVYDLERKLYFESHSGLKETDRLRNLLAVLRINQEQSVMTVVWYLKKALKDPAIHPLTPLTYFQDPKVVAEKEKQKEKEKEKAKAEKDKK